MSERGIGGMGWIRDLPDFRDYTPETPEVKDILAKSLPLQAAAQAMPAAVDVRKWCSPIEDQQHLGSCTAQAGVGLLEYFQRRVYGKHLNLSRLFLYKVTRKLHGRKGDTGASLRATMRAITLFGAPPEVYWEYDLLEGDFDEEPTPFCYALAQNYKAIRYYRPHAPDATPDQILASVKEKLAGELPSMFGFTVFSSVPRRGDGRSDIPYPQPGDYVLGGHAVVAVGYDDDREIEPHRGALLIRNSWGEEWGDKGYGWLPYAYVIKGLAVDFWSLVEAGFPDSDLFM